MFERMITLDTVLVATDRFGKPLLDAQGKVLCTTFGGAPKRPCQPGEIPNLEERLVEMRKRAAQERLAAGYQQAQRLLAFKRFLRNVAICCLLLVGLRLWRGSWMDATIWVLSVIYAFGWVLLFIALPLLFWAKWKGL